MKNKDVNVGMKVVPHSKSVWKFPSIEEYIKTGAYGGFLKENGYLYVTGKESEKVWLLCDSVKEVTGDFFLASDFEPYKEVEKIVRTSNEVKTIMLDNENVKVIRSENATIVILADGSKGIAKCDPADEYDTDYVLLAYARAIYKRTSKSEKQIKIGDEVKVIDAGVLTLYGLKNGDKGVVICKTTKFLGIKFNDDTSVDGHNLDGKLKRGSRKGLWLYPNQIKVV